MVENWVEIPNLEKYLISDRGRVKNVATGRILALQRNQNGNIFISINTDGKRRTFGIARLVANAFVPNLYLPNQDPYTLWPYNTPMHLDGDRFNNSATNLVWRQRWFAIMYQRQFPNNYIHYGVKIVELTTGEHFDTVWDAARRFGLLTKMVYYDAANRETSWFGLEFRIDE